MTSISAASVLCHIRDSTMKDLDKFLQETGKGIDWILLKHNNSTLKALNSVISDGVRTSLCIGMPSGQEPNNNTASSCTTHTYFAQTRTGTSGSGEDGTSAFEEDDIVRAFAEEIQKTVSKWCSKHQFLLQNKPGSAVAAGAYREAMPSSGLGKNSDVWRGGSHRLELETPNLNKPGAAVEGQASGKLSHRLELETQNLNKPVAAVEGQASGKLEFVMSRKTIVSSAQRDDNARDMANAHVVSAVNVAAAVSRDDSARNLTNDDNVSSMANSVGAWHGASHPATVQELQERDYQSLSSQDMKAETDDQQNDKATVVEESFLADEPETDNKTEDIVSQPEVNDASPKSPPKSSLNEEIASQLSDSDNGELHSEDMSHEPDSSMKSDTPQSSIAKKLQNSIKGRTKQKKCNQGGEVCSGVVVAKESSAAPDMFTTPVKSDNKSDSKLALTSCKDLWLPNGTVTKTRVSLTADVKPQIRQRAVQIISSPEWLPAGWVTELKTRNSGNSAGSKDKYYVDPVSKRRFRSRKEVFSFLETGKVNRYRKKSDTSPVRKLLGAEIPCSPPKPMVKKAKTKQNMAPSTSGHPTPITTSAQQSSGVVGNMYVPFRSGQSSDWLVYDGVSSLPFPMFSPFQYGDYNSNKSANTKPQPPAMRQWFFPGPETSWRPYWEQNSVGKQSEKSRGYHDMYSTMTPPPPPPPTFYPELASRPGAGRKLTKKTATGAM